MEVKTLTLSNPGHRRTHQGHPRDRVCMRACRRGGTLGDRPACVSSHTRAPKSVLAKHARSGWRKADDLRCCPLRILHCKGTPPKPSLYVQRYYSPPKQRRSGWYRIYLSVSHPFCLHAFLPTCPGFPVGRRLTRMPKGNNQTTKVPNPAAAFPAQTTAPNPIRKEEGEQT